MRIECPYVITYKSQGEDLTIHERHIRENNKDIVVNKNNMAEGLYEYASLNFERTDSFQYNKIIFNPFDLEED